MRGNKEEIKKWLFLQPEGKTYEIKEYRQKRSNNANSYMWELIGKIADAVHSTKDEVYLIELKRYGVYQKLPFLPTEKPFFKYYEYETSGTLNGKPCDWYTIYKGSSEYDTKEMATLIDGVVNDCHELNIETRTPEEIERIKSLWGEK